MGSTDLSLQVCHLASEDHVTQEVCKHAQLDPPSLQELSEPIVQAHHTMHRAKLLYMALDSRCKSTTLSQSQLVASPRPDCPAFAIATNLV